MGNKKIDDSPIVSYSKRVLLHSMFIIILLFLISVTYIINSDGIEYTIVVLTLFVILVIQQVLRAKKCQIYYITNIEFSKDTLFIDYIEKDERKSGEFLFSDIYIVFTKAKTMGSNPYFIIYHKDKEIVRQRRFKEWDRKLMVDLLDKAKEFNIPHHEKHDIRGWIG